eukprot:CAMPEP_0185907852 /NCGR_PEP_ID=MMETSP0196C-20130402/7771_1 /TAXON_ID=2932 /ORGANISM="Alexandrium fundyense, Strain CCMP1719" /LENGTH=51 /DNA_ID=CAMNT_0028627931 /DNA_START=19 /DNA_END=174 /DNA_ORIENTATION=-
MSSQILIMSVQFFIFDLHVGLKGVNVSGVAGVLIQVGNIGDLEQRTSAARL